MEGAYWACTPPMRSTAAASDPRRRSSSDWRSSSARFSSRSLRTRSVVVQPDRQRLQLVDERRLGVLGVSGELHLRVARQRLLEQDPQLEAGQRGTEAEVAAAGAERLVLRVARDLEAVGVLVAGLVAVRREVPHDHLVALGDLGAVQL